jgi:hypothetical protein
MSGGQSDNGTVGQVFVVDRVTVGQVFVVDRVRVGQVFCLFVSSSTYIFLCQYCSTNNMIYLTAIGLAPGGSSTVHIYTQTMHRTTQSTQTIHRTTQFTN